MANDILKSILATQFETTKTERAETVFSHFFLVLWLRQSTLSSHFPFEFVKPRKIIVKVSARKLGREKHLLLYFLVQVSGSRFFTDSLPRLDEFKKKIIACEQMSHSQARKIGTIRSLQ